MSTMISTGNLLLIGQVSDQNDGTQHKIMLYVNPHIWRSNIFFRFTLEIEEKIIISSKLVE